MVYFGSWRFQSCRGTKQFKRSNVKDVSVCIVLYNLCNSTCINKHCNPGVWAWAGAGEEGSSHHPQWAGRLLDWGAYHTDTRCPVGVGWHQCAFLHLGSGPALLGFQPPSSQPLSAWPVCWTDRISNIK